MTVVQEPHYTAAKAYVGGAIAALVAGLGVVFTGLDDNVITQQEWIGRASCRERVYLCV